MGMEMIKFMQIGVTVEEAQVLRQVPHIIIHLAPHTALTQILHQGEFAILDQEEDAITIIVKGKKFMGAK